MIVYLFATIVNWSINIVSVNRKNTKHAINVDKSMLSAGEKFWLFFSSSHVGSTMMIIA